MAMLTLAALVTASAPWQGTWETTYGTLVLIQEGREVSGFYDLGGPATIEGTVTSGGRMVFTYHEPTASGEGWFDLSGDSLAFSGMWREQGDSGWSRWEGIRSGEGLVVSGYTRSVDWAESAVVEMLYLSLVLERGLAPAEAAAAVEETLQGVAGSPAGVLDETGFDWAE